MTEVLTSSLAGEDLKQKANMGCTDALDLHKTEEDARRYFEDVSEHFDVLLGMIEKNSNRQLKNSSFNSLTDMLLSTCSDTTSSGVSSTILYNSTEGLDLRSVAQAIMQHHLA